MLKQIAGRDRRGLRRRENSGLYRRPRKGLREVLG